MLRWRAFVLSSVLFPLSMSAQLVHDGGNFGSVVDAYGFSTGALATNFVVPENTTITAGRIFSSYQGGVGCTTCDPNFGFRGQFNWALYASTPDGLTPETLLQSGSTIPIKTVIGTSQADFEKQQWDFTLPDIQVTGGQSYWLSLLNTDSTGSLAPTQMYWGGAGDATSTAHPSAFQHPDGSWAPIPDDGTMHSQIRNRMSLQLFGSPTDPMATVPEPNTMLLLGTGLLGIIPVIRRRTR